MSLSIEKNNFNSLPTEIISSILSKVIVEAENTYQQLTVFCTVDKRISNIIHEREFCFYPLIEYRDPWQRYYQIKDPKKLLNKIFRFSCSKGQKSLANILLRELNVDPSAKENKALRKAASNGHLEIVKLLLAQEKVNPYEQDNQVLRKAIENSHIVMLLLAELFKVRFNSECFNAK